MDEVRLSDGYTADSGPALISGVQALIRLLLEQARLDREAGRNTRGYVSGYPGSPLGTLDLELGRARRFLDEEGIIFQPAVNEELAATAIWGSQHIHLYDTRSGGGPEPEDADADIEGVFGLWYGKGPGLDRALDALRHANMGGVAATGGMVLAVGDDPTGKSSTLAYQSEQTLVAAGVPFFNPRRISDIIPMGLMAFALSRHAGCVVGLKLTIDTTDASIVLDCGKLRPQITLPPPPAGVHIGRHDPALVREARLHETRLPAVLAFQSANAINAPLGAMPKRRKLGIVAAGKALVETREALIALGLEDHAHHGIGLFSVTMPWPLETTGLLAFADGFDEILVVEEKRGLVEDQLARALVNAPRRPRLSGKLAPDGTRLLPAVGELSISMLAEAIHKRAAHLGIRAANPPLAADLSQLPAIASRTPWYCAGCPHNTSTQLPEGEIAGMGIGCHSISGFLTPDSITNFTQMGGEGAFWLGRAPFSRRQHSFQNIGDGTYAHSGSLGVRAAVAAGVNQTFKILYNGAVAMTGGQQATGGQPPWMIASQLFAEGVRKVVVVSDEVETVQQSGTWPSAVSFHPRTALLAVQEQLRQVSGVTAIIYVQACATELRRKRKRGKLPQRPEKLLINEAICEGCGDCARQSNCVAVKPVVHADGIKRQIDQTVCNSDYSCREGFCPSFVGLSGGVYTTPQTSASTAVNLPDETLLPAPPDAGGGIRNLFVAGIGGTGVSTLSAVLVMAARLDGVYAQAVNQTGLSQKNGGVTSQIRLSRDTVLEDRTVRLPPASADLLLGCDAVVATMPLALETLNRDGSLAVMNARVDPVGVAGVGIGTVVDDSLILTRLHAVLAPERIISHDTAAIAEALFGSSTAANVMLLGVALQLGLIPISVAALEAALRLNAVAVEDNINALHWGRWLVHDPARVHAAAGLDRGEVAEAALDRLPAPAAVADFAHRLTEYKDAAYGQRYHAVMEPLLAVAEQHGADAEMLLRKAARALYRAMAIKDEYEIARLMTAPSFRAQLAAAGGGRVSYFLAPPLLGFLKGPDGKPRKLRFGSWMIFVFRLLVAMRGLRGTLLDPFGHSAERRGERAFADEVAGWFGQLTETLGKTAPSPELFAAADALVEAVLSVRGYGHIRNAALVEAQPVIRDALEQLQAASDMPATDISQEAKRKQVS